MSLACGSGVRRRPKQSQAEPGRSPSRARAPAKKIRGAGLPPLPPDGLLRRRVRRRRGSDRDESDHIMSRPDECLDLTKGRQHPMRRAHPYSGQPPALRTIPLPPSAAGRSDGLSGSGVLRGHTPDWDARLGRQTDPPDWPARLPHTSDPHVWRPAEKQSRRQTGGRPGSGLRRSQAAA